MTFVSLAVLVATCLVTQQPVIACTKTYIFPDVNTQIQPKQTEPYFSGDSLDVIVSAKSYIIWDVNSGKILKEKNADEERPIASITKLVALLAIRELLSPQEVIVIPPEVKSAQRRGADVELPVGQHAKVQDLIGAALIPSANDAMVTLAIAAKGSEADFVTYANEFVLAHGLIHTKLANATGLQGGEQHSTAKEVKEIMTMAYADPLLRSFMDQKEGDMVTVEGSRHHYKSTDELLGTYLPILAAKTGYTIEAGENLTILTAGKQGQRIGAVVLGSESRFYDMKVLIEWIFRNYTWT